MEPVQATATMPPILQQILGAGGGGNMQFTMGTSANFVIGQVYDINIGPRRITLDLHNKTLNQPVVKYMALAIMLVVTVFVLAYGLLGHDDVRAALLMNFQVTVQILLILIMDVQGLYNKMDFNAKKIFNDAFQQHVDHPKVEKGPDPLKDVAIDLKNFPDTITAAPTSLKGELIATGIIVAMLLPVILEIVGEIKLHDTNPNATGYDTF
jgi:hypothetical protein